MFWCKYAEKKWILGQSYKRTSKSTYFARQILLVVAAGGHPTKN
jgi:hypothetical protein